ncbi:DUF6074 family protein [Bosea sp. (in: a-proteobacteria)]|uniref:DUF6074 family protein n=1 Tax=Bosea sp. (in: a-proteobacteria) TaxID=1871050 RepID=UPI00344F69B0
MSALILPFPTVARQREMARIVDSVGSASPDRAQARLVQHMDSIVAQLRRAQVGEAEIWRNLVTLEAAVWSRLARSGASGGRAV